MAAQHTRWAAFSFTLRHMGKWQTRFWAAVVLFGGAVALGLLGANYRYNW